MSSRRFYLLCVLLYALVGSGYVDTVDSDASYYTAKAMVERWSLRAEPPSPTRMLYAVRQEGCYTKLGLLLPALYVPFVIAGKAAAAITGYPELLFSNFLISFLNALVTAAIVTLLHLFFLRSGVKPRRALALTLIAWLATYLLPYGKTAHREPLQALIVLASLVFVDNPFVVGSTVGAGLLTKIGLLVPLSVPFAIALRAAWRDRERARKLFALLSPLSLALLAWLLYATLAFNGPLRTGYSPRVMSPFGGAWSTPFLHGIYLQLFSPESGFFFYNPCFLLLLLVVRRSVLTRIDWAVLAVFGLQLALHARWFDPTGVAALGPRYLVVVTPALCLLLRHLPERLPRTAMMVVAWSLLVQGAATAVKIQEYWAFVAAARAPVDSPHWAANFTFLSHKLRGEPERYHLSDLSRLRPGESDRTIDLTSARTLTGVNFWWLHGWRLLAEKSSMRRMAWTNGQE